MSCDKQLAMLKKIQEMEFVAVELNLFLDVNPCDSDAVNDYNCAVEMIGELVKEYEQEYGPLMNFGMGGCSKEPWQWAKGPWPWQL